jgi:hypothetical protein
MTERGDPGAPNRPELDSHKKIQNSAVAGEGGRAERSLNLRVSESLECLEGSEVLEGPTLLARVIREGRPCKSALYLPGYKVRVLNAMLGARGGAGDRNETERVEGGSGNGNFRNLLVARRPLSRAAPARIFGNCALQATLDRIAGLNWTGRNEVPDTGQVYRANYFVGTRLLCIKTHRRTRRNILSVRPRVSGRPPRPSPSPSPSPSPPPPPLPGKS